MERRPGRLGAIDMMRAMDVPTLASTAAATGSAGLAPASSRQQPFEGGPGTIPSRLASVTATNQTDAAQLRGSTISLVPPGTAGQPTPSGATALLPLDSAKPQFLQTQSPLPPIHSSTTPLSSDALSLESPVSAFRSFHSSIPHPATVLNLVADESDRQVFTEFDELCNELLSTLGDLEASVEEMTIWKDDFLTQSVPSNVKLQVTLLFARLFRSKSEMHEPLFELLKQVRLYSRPWMNKRFALMELEKDYNSQTHVLDVAVRKMEQLQYQIQRLRSEKRVSLWDRLCRAMLEKFIGVPANEAGGNEQHTEAATKVVIDHEESRPQKAKESRPNSACSIKTEDNVKSGARESKAKKRGRKKSSEPTQNNDNIGSIKENTSMRRDESIFPYGQETPSWQQSNQAGKNSSPVRRTPLVHFEILLHEFFPDVIRHLTRLHRKPFPSPPSIRYVSLHASEAVPVVRKRLPKNMPRSWSIPSFTDIRRLRASADRGGRRARWRLGDGTVVWDAHRGEANKPVAAATRPAMSPPRATRRLRSNSTGILPELRFSDVKLSFAQAIADAGLAAGENVEPDKNFGVRSRPRPLGARKAELYEASNTSSNDDESVSAASDFEFLAEFDETMLEETMGKFLENPGRDHKDDSVLVDNKTGWFTMQDVMELTLIHAQQMQLLQAEYEERLEIVETRLRQSEQERESAAADHEAKLRQAQERAQRIAREVMRATHTATSAGPTDGGAGGAGPRRPGSAGLGSRSVPLQPSQGMQRQRSRDGMGSPGRDVGIRGDEYGDGYGFSGGGFSDVTSFDERSSMGANNRKDKGKKGGKVKRRETPRKPSDRAAVHLHRHEYVVTKKPKFTSAPFAMSFLERLRWFTEEKLKKRREIQDKFVAIEMAANEERLQQLRLIKDREEEGSTQYLDAEFVPYPGAVPPHKIRNIWLEQGIQMPWGGRFHASPQANSGKPEERSSVLNLFDFALSDRRSANMPDDSEAEER